MGSTGAEQVPGGKDVARRVARRVVPRRARPVLRRAVRPLARRTRQVLTGSATVRMTRWDTAEVSFRGRPGARTYRLDDLLTPPALRVNRLRVLVPDVPSLVRLVTSGLLEGTSWQVEVHVAAVPRELRGGSRMPRTTWQTTRSSWRQVGEGLAVELAWDTRRPLDRALSDVLSALTRERRWPTPGGPVFVHDRGGWLAGNASWPQGHLVTRGSGPSAESSPRERTGPFLPPPDSGEGFAWPLVTPVANPYGRSLIGPPARLALQVRSETLVVRDERGVGVLTLDPRRAPEGTGTWPKYCALQVPDALPGGAFPVLALGALAAAGAILLAPQGPVRRTLEEAGLLVFTDAPSCDADPFPAYERSVASSRAALIAGDAVLRRTALAGRDALALPSVSVVVSSKRPEHVETCLGHLAAQSYPSYEVVLGTHGYAPAPHVLERWRRLLPVPLRVVELPSELSLGEALGRLSRVAEGDLLTKVDDDDHYGPLHLTDLVLASRFSGADLVAKSSRFTHFADLGFTIDRTWGASEVYDVTPAGGTLMLARATLDELGGWSTSTRHVDTDLLARARAVGALRYRTHSLGYVYVRRSSGHTWAADHEVLIGQGAQRYDGLPPGILGATADPAAA